MGAYPTGGSPAELLTAMKNVPMQDEASLTYVNTYRITCSNDIGWLMWPPYDYYTLYFDWRGSPETSVAEKGPLNMKYATHKVHIHCVVPYQNADVEEAMVGRDGVRVGLADFVADIIDYYEHNTLSLSGLEPELPPVCEVPEDFVSMIQVGEEQYVRTASILYQARTKHFVRSS